MLKNKSSSNRVRGTHTQKKILRTLTTVKIYREVIKVVDDSL